MKIAAVVILYYPDEYLSQRVFTYLHYIERLYIEDNTETPQLEKLDDSIIHNSKTVIFHNCENRGIAERLNSACKRAIADGYDWLLTMDQDSAFETAVIKRYWEEVRTFRDKQNVAMFGTLYYKEQSVGLPKVLFQKVHSLITSGSIINLILFDKIGGFDEKLFIDEVDLEYCLRSVNRGYDVIQFSTIFLTHQLGIVKQYRSIISLKQSARTLHSPIRLYYMVRNFLYVQAKYKNYFPEELNQSKKALINRIKNNLLYNSKRFQILRYILKGIFDYSQQRMGKIGG